MLVGSECYAYETEVEELGPSEQACYAASMIGFDSVINSRLGVVPEHALELTDGHNTFEKDSPLHRNALLNTIWNAYLWKGSPHTYAVKSFAGCIRNLK